MNSQPISIHRYLITAIAGIIAIPLLVIITYFLVDSYRASMERASFSVQQELEGKASQISSKLNQLQYQIADFSRNRAIGEMAVNILLAQIAHNELQKLVESTPEIASGFISDGSDFIIEGYPNSTYKMQTLALANTAASMMSVAAPGQLPKLEVFRESELYEDKRDSDDKLLVFAIPLFKEMQSIITPNKVTSVLFVKLDLSSLLRDVASYEQFVLQFGDHLLVESKSGNGQNFVSANTFISQLSLDRQEQRQLQLRIGIDRQAFLEHFRENITYAVVFLFFTIGFVGYLVFRLSKNVKQPIRDLTLAAQQFLKGDYQPVAVNEDFEEFAQSVTAMNQMAETIDAQIKHLSEAKLEAEKSEQLKSQFLANMSHEIRTPMNGVLGLLDILSNKIADKQQLSLVKRISDSAQTLLTIVNDILDLSKLEAGKLQIESINFNVKQVLLNVVKTYGHTVKEKGLKLELNTKDLSQDWWQSDPTRITQILNNLTSNAIKFTEQGKVTITVADEIQNQQHWLLFRCSDTGIGLTEEQRQRLFNKFEQADNSTTRRYGGTGLGLSICKSLVEMMGGEIEVSSKKGEGSEFSFKVLSSPGEEQQLIDPDKPRVPDLSRFKVLVAEDNAINQEILRYLLSETNIQTEYVENGELAVQATKRSPADLILMDVQMPQMSGLEATQAIRKLGFTMPIAMQTANVMNEEVRSYMDAGAQAHIGKPIDKQELYTTLERLLEN